jgi:peptide-methionine (S)-S-oxide reductase
LKSVIISLLIAVTGQAASPPSARGSAEVRTARAIFAGGCFWCMDSPYTGLPGVLSVTAGYSGGRVANPSYELVSLGVTGHAESVQILYDPERIGYEQLLDVFWHNIDPFAKNSQFCDYGSQYRTVIFYSSDEERRRAESSKARVEKRFGKPAFTEIVAASAFYPAEEYHQGFCRKSPGRYQAYRIGCGRDQRLKELWGEEAGGHGGTR